MTRYTITLQIGASKRALNIRAKSQAEAWAIARRKARQIWGIAGSAFRDAERGIQEVKP